MANGGWHGTPEQWDRLEAPLIRTDGLIQRFASDHSLALTKNLKDWPERSLRWGVNPSCLIQLYLENEERLTWNLWLCCSEDRDESRYWRNEFAFREQEIDDFIDDLPRLLKEGFVRVEGWKAAPHQLEFATKLSPLPDH